MQISDYIAQLTGKTIEDLFFRSPKLVELEQDANGQISIAYWDESLTASKPAAKDITAALAAPDPVFIPISVSARQFKLQLLAENQLDQVDAWIATQSKAVQIAYEYSGTFLRSDPMMATGFSALGFSDAQIDAFYIAAAAL